MLKNINIEKFLTLKITSFNKRFYYILNHDSEFFYTRIIYYRSHTFSIIKIPKEEYSNFKNSLESFLSRTIINR